MTAYDYMKMKIFICFPLPKTTYHGVVRKFGNADTRILVVHCNVISTSHLLKDFLGFQKKENNKQTRPSQCACWSRVATGLGLAREPPHPLILSPFPKSPPACLLTSGRAKFPERALYLATAAVGYVYIHIQVPSPFPWGQGRVICQTCAKCLLINSEPYWQLCGFLLAFVARKTFSD